MKIAIDIGNTTITIGLSQTGETIEKIYRINTEKNKSSDEYSIFMNSLISSCEGLIISSVVPELNEVFRDYFLDRFNIEALFVGTGVKTGIKINSDNPKEVGADLISNSVAATNIYDETCLIIDLGTATTFTFLENKVLKGVIISTGLTTSRNALISKTSLLPQVELQAPKKVLGTNSVDCIKSGLIFGHASMIDGLIRRVKKETNKQDLKVIITGGHSKIVFPYCEELIIIDETLILKGLLILLKKNNR
ncbi:MAG: type III pantothenate kinase [Candidatus Izemoplasmatales bacterium]|nr:type III pantothenate kinase [Candidatus Izemoplasmatales bacterium]MDD4068931.1 type III pantothenate kinase [Candidatus Izemoplasmatales bacterium]MDY0139697.1 type III pantothenate kinase [Candidatus Izemoplasmatales bacterium]